MMMMMMTMATIKIQIVWTYPLATLWYWNYSLATIFYELLFSIINTRISSINKQFEGLQWIDADDTVCERWAVDLEGLQWT